MAMEFRPAGPSDLPQLEDVYRQIVLHMHATGIPIWDEWYPVMCFPEDIQSRRLFLLADGGVVVSAFALYVEDQPEPDMRWRFPKETALYLARFAVNTDYLRRGIAGLMLRKAQETARRLGAASLRLLVVDENEPALRLYEKNGFLRADGFHDRDVGGGRVLHEFGYEIALSAQADAGAVPF